MAVSPGYSTTATTSATGAVVVPDDQRTFLRNRVSWGAILAGVAAALVTQLLLNVLGIGIGLSALDVDQTADNPSAGGFSLTAGIWFVITGILASLLGGVVAGRLSGTSDDNTARWHGFVSWCVARPAKSDAMIGGSLVVIEAPMIVFRAGRQGRKGLEDQRSIWGWPL